MYSMPSACPELPLELLCHIFAFAAVTSSSTACNLCLVASWVTPIVRPLLYEVVSINSEKALENALDTINRYSGSGITAIEGNDEDRRLASDHHAQLSMHVKRAWIADVGRVDYVRLALRCPNVEDLAIATKRLENLPSYLGAGWENNFHGPGSGEGVGGNDRLMAKVKKLTVKSRVRFFEWFNMMENEHTRWFFINLTHLVLHETDEYMNFPLNDLSNLTHFAVHFNVEYYLRNAQMAPPESRGNSLFFHPASLLGDVGDDFQMFVLMLPQKWLRKRLGPGWRDSITFRDWVLAANKENAKLCVLPYDCNDAERIWEDEARGNGSIWDDADELLREMRSSQKMSK